MSSAIQLGGVVLVILLAGALTRRAFRLPALAFAMLAVPGNVDNLMPQMRLDPHDVAASLAPAISVIDILLVLAVALTIRRGDLGSVRPMPLILATAGTLVVAVAVVALVDLARAIPASAAIRGFIVFGRIALIMWLATRLVRDRTDAQRLAVAIAAGAVVMLANGVYTTAGGDLSRFTATTFGRNGYGVVLVLASVVTAGLARSLSESLVRFRRAWFIGAAIVSGAALFGAVATGTRMTLVVLAVAGIAALVYRRPATSRSLARVALTVGLAMSVIAGSAALSSAGGRTIALVNGADEAIEVVTAPNQVPVYSAIRSRAEFWALAARMAMSEPVLGVGPYQWNILRYEVDPGTPLVVADPHNAYLQVAAEFGLIVLGLYLTLLALVLLRISSAILRSSPGIGITGWSGVGIVSAAISTPVADVTNSNLFNTRIGLFEWLLLGVALVVTTFHRPEAVTTIPND